MLVVSYKVRSCVSTATSWHTPDPIWANVGEWMSPHKTTVSSRTWLFMDQAAPSQNRGQNFTHTAPRFASYLPVKTFVCLNTQRTSSILAKDLRSHKVSVPRQTARNKSWQWVSSPWQAPTLPNRSHSLENGGPQTTASVMDLKQFFDWHHKITSHHWMMQTYVKT